ncbi:MAG: metalloregulator ArsR/SmtB family transcription factor [Candidatus Acetothermia bacterium]|nr:metalloregulator ArsR/SmtB family transcription factor [Candidatus Acetothermia bacterium]
MDRELGELAEAFAALGSEERLRIVSYLLAHRGPHCREIARSLGMSSSAFSYHLRTLEEAGLVLRRREGRWHCLSLAPVLRELLGPQVRTKLTKEGEQWTKSAK